MNLKINFYGYFILLLFKLYEIIEVFGLGDHFKSSINYTIIRKNKKINEQFRYFFKKISLSGLCASFSYDAILCIKKVSPILSKYNVFGTMVMDVDRKN